MFRPDDSITLKIKIKGLRRTPPETRPELSLPPVRDPPKPSLIDLKPSSAHPPLTFRSPIPRASTLSTEALSRQPRSDPVIDGYHPLARSGSLLRARSSSAGPGVRQPAGAAG
ncbi:hypothetical protein GCM10025331_22810 [Actinoplanes utahensis]|nr:hypothetical protein Aut01nite_34570 [Actinoplanes utahensis]